MTRIKVTNNFYLDEFLDPYTYFTDANRYTAIDQRLFKIAQFIREKYEKPLYINTWYSKYDEYENDYEKYENNNSLRKWSGLRSIRCKIGAKFSAHRKGLAIDLKGDEKVLFQIIKDNAKELYEMGVRRIEDIKITKGWLHVDLWNKNNVKGIEVVDLKKVVDTILI